MVEAYRVGCKGWIGVRVSVQAVVHSVVSVHLADVFQFDFARHCDKSETSIGQVVIVKYS
jgi:hypothetical protein